MIYDVIVLGAGLAGLSLARHLQMTTDKRVLLLEKRRDLPAKRQKVGESLVQVGGYYFAKVLDMEEHMLHDQFMKYNLRFYWKNKSQVNDNFEDYDQAYIRTFSNIPCYQLDRNTFEGELLRRIRSDARVEIVAPAEQLRVTLGNNGERHVVSIEHQGQRREFAADWVVDTTGQGRLLARQLQIREPSPIHHSAAFMWVEGLVDIEKLTGHSLVEIRRNKNRRATGHLPPWLATNHFMGEGFWFWVIPLRGKTSLGLVFDNRLFPAERVSSAEKLRDWAVQEFPLFARDLPQRKIIEFSALKDYAHGCSRTIHPARWAMAGVAGRFTDPLYSPGSDFIALHNTLIVDAISTTDRHILSRKCMLYERLMQAMYNSLLPTYSASYEVLGDQETFVLKYTWELSVYFAFFVFPFINDLGTDIDFVPSYLARFSRLGDMNARLQSFLKDYYTWKKNGNQHTARQILHDFMSLEPLRRAEQTFYQVGAGYGEAKDILDDQLLSLKELARFIVAYIYAAVLNDPRVLINESFVESIDLKHLEFNPDRFHADYAPHRQASAAFAWTLNPDALQAFCRERAAQAIMSKEVMATARTL